MIDYDAERIERHRKREQELGDRSFTIGGETFTYRSSIANDTLKRIATPQILLEGGAFIESVENNVLDLIEDNEGDHERFLDLLKRQQDPITFEDLQLLCASLVEKTFGRPTEASLPSSDGDAKTGISLTENSPIEQVEGFAA